MKRDDFHILMDNTFERMKELNTKKGKDYAGDEDALSNFKAAAERLGVTPFQIWAVYADKHWSAIMSFCKEGQLESEPIEGRIDDVMVYCTLLLGLIKDRVEAEIGPDEPTPLEPQVGCAENGPDGNICLKFDGHAGSHTWEIDAV